MAGPRIENHIAGSATTRLASELPEPSGRALNTADVPSMCYQPSILDVG